jgi:hypothetical protein
MGLNRKKLQNPIFAFFHVLHAIHDDDVANLPQVKKRKRLKSTGGGGKKRLRKINLGEKKVMMDIEER